MLQVMLQRFKESDFELRAIQENTLTLHCTNKIQKILGCKCIIIVIIEMLPQQVGM